MYDYKIAVIGGGAAGMTAAWSAASGLADGRQVILLEGNPRLGRKLLATGNGRCNYSNTGISAEAYRQPDFVRAVLSAYPPSATEAFFAAAGLCSREEEGRLYPASGTAASVLEVLRLSLEETGAVCRTEGKVKALTKSGEGFSLRLEGGEKLTARRVILACGSPAGGNLGCPGGGYHLAGSLGHHLIEPRPGLTAFCCPEDRRKELGLKALNGVRIAAVLTWRPERGGSFREEGEVLFREYGLSGIAVFQLSRFPGPGILSLDLWPREEEAGLKRRLFQRRCQLAKRQAGEFFTGMFQKMIGLVLLKGARVRTQGRLCGQLEDEELKKLAKEIKNWCFPIAESKGWEQAQIALGGLAVEEFTAATLESRLCPGFFAAGEVLDVDGPCGGYNLQWAWSSGLLAGREAARSVTEEARHKE